MGGYFFFLDFSNPASRAFRLEKWESVCPQAKPAQAALSQIDPFPGGLVRIASNLSCPPCKGAKGPVG